MQCSYFFVGEFVFSGIKGMASLGRGRDGIVGKECGEGFLARAGGGAERPDHVYGQAAGRVAGDRGGGDVIRVHASEMRKMHDAREYSWEVEHAAAADLAQHIDHNIQLQTEELQKLDAARERAWHDERAAAAEQLADARLEQVVSQVKQLPERIKSEMRAEAPDAAVAKTRWDELHDRMHLAATVTAEVETAVTKQLADEQTNVMQLEERLTAHVGAAIVTSCAMGLLG